MKCGQAVFVYTMSADGHVMERSGVIAKITPKNAIIRVYGGQRIVLARTPCKISKDSMWSKTPQKNVYVELMLEILNERREVYRERIASTTRRIANIRNCAG